MSTITTPEQPQGAPVISVGIEEAVRITGLSRTTIWRLEKRGVVKVSRVGRRRVFPIADLKKIVKEGAKT